MVHAEIMGDSCADLIPERHFRVLFVPDSIYWITGRIAQQIIKYNEWIDGTICSHTVLRKVMRSNAGKFPARFDLVHFLTPVIATDLISEFCDASPCVATIHHVEDARSTEPASRSDAIMTVCAQWHRFLVEQGVPGSKLVMVPNGVDADLFRPGTEQERSTLRRRFGLHKKAFVIGFSAKASSNSHNRKGIDTLVQAVHKIQERIPNVALMIVGPGWSELVEQQRRLGIACCYLPFLLDHKDLAPVYRSLDVFWVTASIEGGPVPLLEAMSSGVCCVTTPVGVALEIVRDGTNALLAKVGDATDFVEKTQRLASNDELRSSVGREARKAVLEKFQLFQTTQSVRHLYRSAVSAFRSRQAQSKGVSGANFASPANSHAETLPRSLLARILADEHLMFREDLLRMGAGGAAFKVALRSLRYKPLDPKIWRSILSVSPLGGPARALLRTYRLTRNSTKRLPGNRS